MTADESSASSSERRSSPSSFNPPYTPDPFTVARLLDHTQREEQFAQAQLAKWAADLQRALRNERARFAALAEIARRRQAYLGGRRPIDPAGRDAIVVDDGVATGATVMAALRAARHRSLTRLVIAVPVAPAVALARLRDEADEAVCLASPPSFSSVGQFYRAFLQITDGEVVALLLQARAQASSATP